MNIKKAVFAYIEGRPSIKDCLKKGLINYSSLTRQIIKDLGITEDDFDATLIAWDM